MNASPAFMAHQPGRSNCATSGVFDVFVLRPWANTPAFVVLVKGARVAVEKTHLGILQRAPVYSKLNQSLEATVGDVRRTIFVCDATSKRSQEMFLAKSAMIVAKSVASVLAAAHVVTTTCALEMASTLATLRVGASNASDHGVVPNARRRCTSVRRCRRPLDAVSAWTR